MRGEFLWNAKPRFGKTLSAYDLARRLGVENVLIVTNRPAIANSWYDDYQTFIKGATNYVFVSDSASLKDRQPLTRKQYSRYLIDLDRTSLPQITFLSLQDLKGGLAFGGTYEKLDWVARTEWDLLIIDEAHEGIDTGKTDRALETLERKWTLHLSGTPFKQIADQKFPEEAIYNWTYTDECQAREAWSGLGSNPYADLPQLNMYTYQMSRMLVEKLEEARANEAGDLDYAFDLNEFFKTDERGRFIYESDVKKWLDMLTKGEKYPFSTKALRQELKHTFWYLNRVDSAKALARLLNNHPVFENYKVILAVGSGKNEMDDGERNRERLKQVQEAILKNDKTITLSVGQLTTGVTVPEWTGVLMLNNLHSPAAYMQAAFRAQNAHLWEEKLPNGELQTFRKENAYIFDFAPERTLILVDEFANNLHLATSQGGGTSEERQANIQELLNFFPVIGEDAEGRMQELDASQVLTIPKNIKAQEVVRRGFMSNLLFNQISNIFQAPKAVLDIITKIKTPPETGLRTPAEELDPDAYENIHTNSVGDVITDKEVVLTHVDHAYRSARRVMPEIIGEVTEKTRREQQEELDKKDFHAEVNEPEKTIIPSHEYAKTVVSELEKDGVFKNLGETYGMTTKAAQKKLANTFETEFTKKVKDEDQAARVARAKRAAEYRERLSQAKNDVERQTVNEVYREVEKASLAETLAQVKEKTAAYVEETIHQQTENLEREKIEKEKFKAEDNVRNLLRGFARTIPSFIMAYGDRDLRLQNFDQYTPADVFLEVSGITIAEFCLLRDGGRVEVDGEEKTISGDFFDEQVFDQSVQEFLDKREALADYFDDEQEGDIFDYIPIQETNQIFTPKRVVQKMIQQLEDENPGIYEDLERTFIDLYMKSGLYITEIVKRLYESETHRKAFPHPLDRMKHILEHQVYGLAPTEIIYRIAIRFIFGNMTEDMVSRKHFKCFDAYPAAREGRLEEALADIFKD